MDINKRNKSAFPFNDKRVLPVRTIKSKISSVTDVAVITETDCVALLNNLSDLLKLEDTIL